MLKEKYLKISVSDICNKLNDDFNLKKGNSAVEQTQFKKIKNVLKYLNNNDIETKLDVDNFYIINFNIFKDKMINILNLNSDEISESEFISTFKEIISNYEENNIISLADTMNIVNKKFNIVNGSSAIKHTKFKKPSKFINYIIKKEVPIELHNNGNGFTIKDKNKTLEILDKLLNTQIL